MARFEAYFDDCQTQAGAAGLSGAVRFDAVKRVEQFSRKQIKVRVNRPKLVIRSRDSYIVGANENSADSDQKAK